MKTERKTLFVTHEPHGLLSVSLNRPDVRNAFNEHVIQELGEVFTDAATSNDVRAVVIKGEGSVFCAGGDLTWMKEAINYDFERNLNDSKALGKVLRLIDDCPKPVIGLAHGAAMGGGVGLVSVCDYVIASKETQFTLSEVKLGLIPAVISPFVISKIGPSQARALFITAKRFSAIEALQMGLIHQIVESTDLLAVECKNILDSIFTNGPLAMKEAKKLVKDVSDFEVRRECKSIDHQVSERLATIRVSPEGQEGVRAFLEKRKPSWMTKI